MNRLNWTEQNLTSLGSFFLRNVRDHMRGDEGATVRFGVTGIGVQPNYQITFSNGVVRTIRGSSHEAFNQADEFQEDRISDPFTLAAIQRAYEQ